VEWLHESDTQVFRSFVFRAYLCAASGGWVPVLFGAALMGSFRVRICAAGAITLQFGICACVRHT
jgi:hypothetical protein